ncbi:hypothetical protein GJ633_00330 [Halorubrum sp. CBA1125]|uniref:hypothetical protein n=1 Tax=Halorubrum sp. CBA1125 TaxID=2668072 RepID=UPI0012E85614|nr:hypothetical protein [Halorubrum sp. CBA1125]MUW13263.1 hypothetical protein [Halorubrum sp. CBA1125]
MSDDDERPAAEHVSVNFGQPTTTTPIQVDGESLLSEGYYQAKVCVRIGDQDSMISVTLSPADARALRDDLDDAVDEARAEVERWLNRDGSCRR